jgi:hypothetical protein
MHVRVATIYATNCRAASSMQPQEEQTWAMLAVRVTTRGSTMLPAQ